MPLRWLHICKEASLQFSYAPYSRPNMEAYIYFKEWNFIFHIFKLSVESGNIALTNIGFVLKNCKVHFR